MPEGSGFEAAFAKAVNGTDADLDELLTNYGSYIKRVIRSRLNRRLRSKFDSVDFVQMVWASFFTQPQALARFDHPRKLLKYLTTMARNKVVEENRSRLSPNCRHRGDEELLGDHVDEVMQQYADTPSQVAIARERIYLLEAAGSPSDRDILRLRMQGLTYKDIATRMGMHERSVRRIVSRLLKTG